MKEHAQPKFFRPRLVPFVIKDALARVLEHLEDEGVLTKVEFSCWATPIVPFPKKDGTFLICGNFKVTVNPALEVDQHPIPKPEDIFASCLVANALAHWTWHRHTSGWYWMMSPRSWWQLIPIWGCITSTGFYPSHFPTNHGPITRWTFQGDVFREWHHCHWSRWPRALDQPGRGSGWLRARGFRLKKEKCPFFQPIVHPFHTDRLIRIRSGSNPD